MFGKKSLVSISIVFVLGVLHLFGDDRGASLETLLAELRILKHVRRQEAKQATQEFNHLQRLIDQKTAAVSETKENRNVLVVEQSRLDKTITAAESATADLVKADIAQRDALLSLLKTMTQAVTANPLLTDDAGSKRLADLLKPSAERATSALTSGTMAQLLAMSARIPECQVLSGTISLLSGELHVDQLRLGSLAVLWLTRDTSRCGYGTPGPAGMRWIELPNEELPAIRKAFRVAREDQPADVILLPLPINGGKE